MSRERFAVRTIRNGSVRIGGKRFVPDTRHFPYDGRLDGQRFAFGRYWIGDRLQIDQQGRQFVCLWGTERAFRSHDTEVDWPGPECVDGVFVWEWWKEARP